jgi:hypothetical protein
VSRREPNTFQRQALRKIQDALSPAGDGAPNLTWEEGDGESYWRITWNTDDGTIDAYIYDDEAGIMRNGSDWTAFENPDYRSPSDLLTSFVAKLHEIVEHATMDGHK